MKNLEYSATAAYLSAGKYWEKRAESIGSEDKADKDTMALFHRLELSFYTFLF